MFIARAGLDPIIDAAYLLPATQLAQRGRAVRFVVPSAIGEFVRPQLRRRWIERRRTITEHLPRGLTRLVSPPSRFAGFWDDSVSAAQWLKWKYGRAPRVILHCHGVDSARIALGVRRRLPGVKVVLYSLGPYSQETVYGLLGEIPPQLSPDVQTIANRCDERERFVFQNADAVVCLSQKMIQYGAERYGLEPARTAFIPFFLDIQPFLQAGERRPLMRDRLDLGSDATIVYCGSLHRWQRPAEIVRVFRLIATVRPKVRFLTLTTNPDKMRELARSAGIVDAARHLKVPYQKVPDYLAAADLGIIGRGLFEQPMLINGISSPIKFGEYLAAGCPVILAEGIGDFSEMAETFQLGTTIPCDAGDEAIADLIGHALDSYAANCEDVRRRCRDFAQERFCLDKAIDTLMSLYQRLDAV
ncbi:MAG: glycosyltransferase [Planctomycetaceae bacterium]